MDRTINHLSLCTGYGGIDLGLRAVLPTCRAITYVEIEAFACANLVAKMEAGRLDPAPIWTNLRTFDARAYRGHVDILSGGFPCQPFSQAGSRRADEDPRHLFPEIERIIDECRPNCVFLENVEGIISARLQGAEQTSVLKHVMERLESRGYTSTWGMFSAEEVGAPHRRNRVFILAVRNANSHSQSNIALNDETSGLPRIGREHTEEDLADGFEPRLEGHAGDEHGESGQDRKRTSSRSATTRCVQTRWPASPGEKQYRWEEPRTIKRELGGTTDGDSGRLDAHQFRTDRLRLLGNGVVPATAAIAFRTLFTQLQGASQ